MSKHASERSKVIDRYALARAPAFVREAEFVKLELNGIIFRMGQFCIYQKPLSNELFFVFVSTWPARCFLALMAQLNALIILPQQVTGLVWK